MLLLSELSVYLLLHLTVSLSLNLLLDLFKLLSLQVLLLLKLQFFELVLEVWLCLLVPDSSLVVQTPKAAFLLLDALLLSNLVLQHLS